MIVTELYNGQGLGNQLWCYVVTRVIAKDRGLTFGIESSGKFKGKEFLNLQFGESVVGGFGPEGGPPNKLPDGVLNYYKEKRKDHPVYHCDISPFDPELIKVPDQTKIEGTMQSENYILHRKSEIIEWLKPTKQINNLSADDICVIHFRGGDFLSIREVLLPAKYYYTAMKKMKEKNPKIHFVVVTDDPASASRLLGGIPIVGSSSVSELDKEKASHHLGGPVWMDYTILNNAKNVIMSNSSFGWWAVWTNINAKNIIAPKYWARHNISDGFWSNGDSLTREWEWLDRDGKLFSYEQCLTEFINYNKANDY